MLALAPLLLAACAHHTRRAPALTEPAAQTPSPPQPGFLSRTADATWTVVSAPVRLVTPNKNPIAATPKSPPTYDAPEAIIMTPTTDADITTATTQSK